MSGNKWWYIAAKLLSDLVIFSILSSEILLDFCNSIRVVPLKYLMYILVVVNTNIWNILKEKYFAPLRILDLSIKSFVNTFVDIALTFLWCKIF